MCFIVPLFCFALVKIDNYGCNQGAVITQNPCSKIDGIQYSNECVENHRLIITIGYRFELTLNQNVMQKKCTG